ncbi:hypothetical protein LR48_Vigan10g165000 [Vigna angularis]|uniref:Putative plant transposon protein domain-containing protein n=1 Tax=Phaseolus angularis TaxID=3914 RepID=A0A0L9VLA8_PHAAN|nr:hypothetical protein LR48_Vigan10g165000 [Vigna angularis]
MTSSSGKRIKTIGSKRKDKEPECSYASKNAGLITNFAPQFGEQLENRNWGRPTTYPTPANIAVVKEFYTNARRLGDHPVEDYLSYVRGHAIRYDPDSINRFLNTEWAGHFQRNRNGVVVNIRRAELTPLGKYWMAFPHANIQSCSHVSNITVSRTLLLYFVLRGMSINIGQVIANEIQVCANTMNNKAPLGNPSLITHLCELAGVNISTPPFERPRKAIDEAYYRQYCGRDEAAQPEFNNVVAWLEEQAQGAGAAEAPAMDDDEDDDDEFEDDEDDGEEEDSNESMG